MGATVARWRMSPGEGESEASDGGEREMGQATAIQVERMKDGPTAVACCVRGYCDTSIIGWHLVENGVASSQARLAHLEARLS